jgi:hypothetical protein
MAILMPFGQEPLNVHIRGHNSRILHRRVSDTKRAAAIMKEKSKNSFINCSLLMLPSS